MPYNINNSDTTKYNVDEVLREAISSLKNDSRFLSITIQPENYDEQKSNVLQPVIWKDRQKKIYFDTSIILGYPASNIIHIMGHIEWAHNGYII